MIILCPFIGFSKHTIRRYKSVITFYCRHASIKNLEEVTEKNTRDFFYIGRSVRHWKPNTFITFHKSLTVFFRWCVEHKYMVANPMNEIQIPKLEKRLPPKLTKQDSLKLLEIVYNYPYENKFLHYRNHAIFSILIFAGLRKSELLKLRLTDVDTDNLTIFFNQGKGSKDRIIPMSYTLAQSLKKYLDERKRYNKTCSEFFASSNRNIGFTESGIKRLVEKYVRLRN